MGKLFINPSTRSNGLYISRSCTILLVFCLLASVVCVQLSYAGSSLEINVNATNVIGTNTFSLGFQLDWPQQIATWSDSTVLRELAHEANFKLVRIIAHDVEPCTYWYDSSRTGNWNWAQVDSLLSKVFEIGAEPLICFARYDQSSRRVVTVGSMTTNPATGLPYFESWAAYCAEWVRHLAAKGFPVRYYEMLNEPYKYYGWDPSETTLIGNFAKFFDTAAKAMKNVNPKVMVSFDASTQKKAFDYFLSHGYQIDFIDVHKYGNVVETLGITDAELLSNAETYRFDESSNWYGVDFVRQTWFYRYGKMLPVIVSEYNLNWTFKPTTDSRIPKMVGVIWSSLMIRSCILRKYDYASYFVFADKASHFTANGGYGFGMVNLDDNKPKYPYYLDKILGNSLSVGDSLVEVTSSSDDVRTLAWVHGEEMRLLLICKVNEPRIVYLHGIQGQLNCSKIDASVSWTTPAVQNGTLAASDAITLGGYTVMLLQGKKTISSLFEDGFESGNFGNWSGKSVAYGETISVTNTLEYSGVYSAKVTSNGGGGTEYSYCYTTTPSSSELYARGYFYVSRSGIVENDDRFYFIVFRAGSNNVAYAGWRKTGGIVKWTLLIKNGSGTVIAYSDSGPSLNQWYCVELHWKKDATQGTGQLWINGVNVCSITSKNTASFGNITEARLGLPALYNCGPTTAYCDQVKLSQEFIGT